MPSPKVERTEFFFKAFASAFTPLRPILFLAK